MPNISDKWNNFMTKCHEMYEEYPWFKEDLDKHTDLQDDKDYGMSYRQYEVIREKKEENESEINRLSELQSDYINSNDPLTIACGIVVEENKAAKLVDTSKFIDQSIINNTSNWNDELRDSAYRRNASFAAYRSAVNDTMDAAEAYVVARQALYAMIDASSSEDEVIEDELYSPQLSTPVVNRVQETNNELSSAESTGTQEDNNQGRPNTGSLIDDYADTSLDMQSYMNPED